MSLDSGGSHEDSAFALENRPIARSLDHSFPLEQMRKNAERGNEVRGPVRRRKAHLMVFYKVKIRGDWFAA
jgi:hypothetical protein